MESDTDAARIIERYFEAMRTGSAADEDVIDLFADDAEYVEPFSGAPATHTGKHAIRDSIQASQRYAPPDMTLRLDQVTIDGDQVVTRWTCESPALPHPMRGQDLWTIREGKVSRLETRFLA